MSAPANAPAAPQRIKALDESVINRIAAGEIIVAPVNALKELIENSVDAGSSSIEISVKEGGLKLLQITDNGHGITREDLPILCERFTTSKLKAFEDLSSIGTYGFRGEALASISMIAHLTVTTKTADSDCAWRAVYSDGKLVPPKPGQSADPRPIAGRRGTQITVEDLFYNTPSRRRAFRSPPEEYAKILDIVGRYAVHCDGVAFSCKKHGDNDVGLATTSNAGLRDRIRRVHGSAVANELVELEVAEKSLGFRAKGMVSNANYHVKKTTLLLFINGRSVESSAIKKSLDAAYSAFLPKGGHPFIYLALDIEPHRVDVNVHPTKREVNFLHEDEVVERISSAVQEKLAAIDTSRSYALTQTLLPGSEQIPQKQAATITRDGDSGQRSTKTSADHGLALSARQQVRKPYENNTVRVDARDRKITAMLQPSGHDSNTRSGGGGAPGGGGGGRGGVDGGSGGGEMSGEYEYDDSREWEDVRYASVRSLRKEVRDSAHTGLAELFGNHIFVGLVDDSRRLAAIQHGVKLYLVDYAAVCYELFYQIGLSDFRNFGHIRLDPPLLLKEILQIAVNEERERIASNANAAARQKSTVARDEDHDTSMENAQADDDAFDWEGVIQTVETLLIDKRVMLRDYFSLEISEDGRSLISIPLLLRGYMPSLAKLPSFLLRLGPNVVWSTEKECFVSFLRELALFYVPEILPPEKEAEEQGSEEVEEAVRALMVRRKELTNAVETVLFPAFRRRLIPTSDLLASVTEIANLKGLYRIFERSC